MIGLIQKMFGDQFWENTILEATHWNYHNKSVDLRESSNPPITETWCHIIELFFPRHWHKMIPHAVDGLMIVLLPLYYLAKGYQVQPLSDEEKSFMKSTLGGRDNSIRCLPENTEYRYF